MELPSLVAVRVCMHSCCDAKPPRRSGGRVGGSSFRSSAPSRSMPRSGGCALQLIHPRLSLTNTLVRLSAQFQQVLTRPGCAMGSLLVCDESYRCMRFSWVPSSLTCQASCCLL